MRKFRVDTKIAQREGSLDFLKGVAVIFMVITHVTSFFKGFDYPLLKILADIGGVVCFTTFMFCSGASLSFSYFKDEILVEKKNEKLLKRSLRLLLTYYLVCVVALLPVLVKNFWQTLFRIIFFVEVPLYVEFMLPFIFYGIMLVPLRSVFSRLRLSVLESVIVGVVLYIFASIVWASVGTINSAFIKTVVAVLFGYKNWHRFPLFQYGIVFLTGILWGEFLISTRDISMKSNLEKRFKYSTFILLANLVVFGLFYGAGILFGGPSEAPFLISDRRFPPSVSFLFMSFLLVSVLNFAFFLWKKLMRRFSNEVFEKIYWFINWLGINVFSIFAFHTTFLYLINFWLGDTKFEPIFIWWMILVVIALSILVISASDSIRKFFEEKTKSPRRALV